MTIDSLLGNVIAGRFRVIEQMGEGAMGLVYLAEHEVLERRVVIKVLRRELSGDDKLVERFRREARALSRLQHAGIVYVADFGQTDDGRFYLVMEYIEGESLRAALDGAQPAVLPLARVLDILVQLAEALDVAHDAGVIHRDLKPANILLGAGRGGVDRVKVLDFGLAKIVTDTKLERTLTERGELFGTPIYMSPEQAAGQLVDGRTDVYAFGVIAYELLAGRPPFVGRTLAEILRAHAFTPARSLLEVRPALEPTLPDDVADILMRCLAKDPDERPARMDRVRRALREAADALDPLHDSEGAYSVVPGDLYADDLALWDDETTGSQQLVFGDEVTGVDAAFDPRQTVFDPRSDAPRIPENASNEWIWHQVGKLAKSLAEALRDCRVAPVELLRTTTDLRQAEERTLAQQTEIALLHARQDDLEVAHGEREATLRYACVDLSLERSRLLDEGAEAALIADLDQEIAGVERRLGEIIRETQAKQRELTAETEGAEAELATLTSAQYDSERRLLDLLLSVRNQVEDPALLVGYDRIQQLLALLTRRSTVQA